MRAFDSDRMRETVVYLARHVHDLYRTKLNKVLFYLDFAAYRDGGEGFTGSALCEGAVRSGSRPVRAAGCRSRRRRGARIARTGRRPGDRCGTRGGSHLFFCIRPEACSTRYARSPTASLQRRRYPSSPMASGAGARRRWGASSRTSTPRTFSGLRDRASALKREGSRFALSTACRQWRENGQRDERCASDVL